MEKEKYVSEWTAKNRNYFSKTKRQYPLTAKKVEPNRQQPLKVEKRESQDKSKSCSNTESESFQRSKNLSLMRQSLTGTTLSWLRNLSPQRQSLNRNMSEESSEDPRNKRSTHDSTRSDESQSSGYESGQGPRRKMPEVPVSKIRSSSCLTSQEKNFEAWKKRKDSTKARCCA